MRALASVLKISGKSCLGILRQLALIHSISSFVTTVPAGIMNDSFVLSNTITPNFSLYALKNGLYVHYNEYMHWKSSKLCKILDNYSLN